MWIVIMFYLSLWLVINTTQKPFPNDFFPILSKGLWKTPCKFCMLKLPPEPCFDDASSSTQRLCVCLLVSPSPSSLLLCCRVTAAVFFTWIPMLLSPRPWIALALLSCTVPLQIHFPEQATMVLECPQVHLGRSIWKSSGLLESAWKPMTILGGLSYRLGFTCSRKW